MTTIDRTQRRRAGRGRARTVRRPGARRARRRYAAGSAAACAISASALLSLAVFLVLWEWAGANIDPVLFTTPIGGRQGRGRDDRQRGIMDLSVAEPEGAGDRLFAGVPSSASASGLLLARYEILDVALSVYITFLYSIPSVALVPLIVLWAGFETPAKVIILFLFAFFPMVINTYQGVKSVDPKLVEVGRAFRCSERQLWGNIVLPAALPFIVTGLRLALGRGLIGMVLADLYTAISGIGYLIVRTASTYRVDKMFVPIVTLGLLGVTLTALLRLAEKYVAPWTNASDED